MSDLPLELQERVACALAQRPRLTRKQLAERDASAAHARQNLDACEALLSSLRALSFESRRPGEMSDIALTTFMTKIELSSAYNRATARYCDVCASAIFSDWSCCVECASKASHLAEGRSENGGPRLPSDDVEVESCE